MSASQGLSDISSVDDSSPPPCFFLTQLPDEEVKVLKVGLARGWKSVKGDLKYATELEVFPPHGMATVQARKPRQVGDDSEPQATLTDIYQLSKHVSCISPTFVMIDQVSGRTKTVTLAHFVAQEGGQSYLYLRREFRLRGQLGHSIPSRMSPLKQ